MYHELRKRDTRERAMSVTTMGLRIAAAALLAALMVCTAAAQQTMRVRGTIEKLDGNALSLKASDGAALTIRLTDNAQVVAVEQASVADIKPGSYVGSAAMPQADGSQKALEVHIFPEAMRGSGEGHRPFAPVPNSTMTNGTVGKSGAVGDGHALTLTYREGEKQIVLTPGIPIVSYVIGSRADLKPGAHVTILSAAKKPDGTLETTRVNVGRNGVVPQ
jgi:hypothetical protein